MNSLYATDRFFFDVLVWSRNEVNASEGVKIYKNR